MRGRSLLLAALGLVAGLYVWAAVPAQAAPPSPTAQCDPENPDMQRRECRRALRTKPVVPTRTPAPVTSGKSVLPFTYAYVVTGPVALYTDPADADNGTAPLRTLDAGYIWVRLLGQAVHNGETWY